MMTMRSQLAACAERLSRSRATGQELVGVARDEVISASFSFRSLRCGSFCKRHAHEVHSLVVAP